MQLLDQLEDLAANSESLFRRVLAKEDAARLQTLWDLAATAETRDVYLKEGQFIGWTRDDMRTWELKEQLVPLMEAIYELRHASDPGDLEETINAAWAVFNQHRMKILVHCL